MCGDAAHDAEVTAHAREGNASLTDIGIPVTPIGAALIGTSVLLVLGLLVGLVLLVRARLRRRRAVATRADSMSGGATRAGVASASGPGVPLGSRVRRAVPPPLFAERGVEQDPMTARLRAATGPLEVIEALRSADAADADDVPAAPVAAVVADVVAVPVVADVPAMADVPTPASVPAPDPLPVSQPAGLSVAGLPVEPGPVDEPAPVRPPSVALLPSHARVRTSPSDSTLIATLFAGGMVLLLVSRRRGRRSGR